MKPYPTTNIQGPLTEIRLARYCPKGKGNERKIPLHSWYSTIAKENFSNFLGLAPIFLTLASCPHALLNYIQNRESKSHEKQKCNHELEILEHAKH